MSESASSFEAILRDALAPVEPPDELALRLEDTLQSITDLAADELQEWELAAMRDPRNWVRPATAVVAGGVAGTALVLLRARRRARVEVARGGVVAGARRTAERALQDMRSQTRRMLGGD